MKKIFTLFTVGFAFYFLNKNNFLIARAASPTPPPSASTGAIMNQQEIEKIQKIKDLVASRVAELKLVEKRSILGKVVDSSNTQITIDDGLQRRIIDIDELTKFQSSQKSFGISDINNGNIVAALGLYNKETKRLLARFITLKKGLPVQFEGVILKKDSKNYELLIADQNGKKKTIEVQTSTKTFVYTKDDGLVKSGFSKITESERIILTGYQDLKDENTIIPTRLLRLPELLLSPGLKNQLNLYNQASRASSSAE